MKEEIKQLIAAIREDKPLEVKKAFSALGNSQVVRIIEDKKKQIAQKLFAKK